MTIKNKKIAKRACAVMLSVVMATGTVVPTSIVKADEAEETEIANAYEDEGYTLKWNDEFEGTSLNTEDWNVEARPKGWVNSELQRYVSSTEMADNIQVSDGTLKIKPKAEKKVTSGAISTEAFEGNVFNETDWLGNPESSFSYEEGKAVVNITNVGSNPWDVQLKNKTGLSLETGHTYRFSVKAVSDIDRNVLINLMADESWYAGGQTYELKAGEEQVLTFDANIDGKDGRVTTDGGELQINMGNLEGDTSADASLAKVTFSEISFVDLSAKAGNEILKGDGFTEEYWGTLANPNSVTYTDGKAIVDVKEVGAESHLPQIQQPGLTLTEGHKYKVSLKVSSDKARKVQVNVMDAKNNRWAWYGGWTGIVGTDETEVTIDVDVDGTGDPEKEKTTSDGITLQLNLGTIDNDTVNCIPAKVTFSDVSFVDLTETTSSDDINNYNFTSGRINTQGIHDFTYGRFEARAKVPTGQGYLPAFWLMASDEDNYGQWPRCGEIDIMEVMGQETSKSYHTIHYGYNATTGHKENQGTKITSNEEKDFADDFHVFRVDWEPGLITWYVDGEEVYKTNRWYTGTDEESQLTYPAPFDQNFYIILNLAVGGSWVQNPNMNTVNDMANQEYEIDYVRVYQKDKSVYEEAESDLKAPEPEEVVFREAENGNYVKNGNFATDINRKDDATNNWVLHVEKDCAGSTAVVNGNAVTLTPSAKGSVTHAVQLKQEKVPMYKGWTYELSFDAVATANRSIVVNIEGPDHGWTRYMKDTTFNVTTDKQTFTKEFTMEEKTDANGSLEFNLGAQDSTDAVTISNVKLIHKSGDVIQEDTSKKIRSDGNYIYNGGFDQGDKRLGYWEIDENETRVSVTNKDNVRELCAKIEVPEGTTEVKPVVISQSELFPLSKGEYKISFDAYMAEGGSSDALTVDVAGMNYVPVLTAEKANYSKKLNMESDIVREASNVTFTFTKPGTYYLDNVMLAEDAMIKNGSFASGKVGYEFWYDNSADASWGVDSITEQNTAAVVDISKTGEEDYMVQLKQNDVKLVKNHKYKLEFSARATIDRKIRVIMQGGEKLGWPVYSSDNIVDLTKEYQKFEDTFVMEKDTDEAAFLSICMGQVGEGEIDEVHRVCIDDIYLVDLGEVESEKEPEKQEEEQKPEEKKLEEKKPEEKKQEDEKQEEKPEEKKTEALVQTPVAAPANDNGNGSVEVGEKAVTEQGTFTATSATEAVYTPSETAKKSGNITIPATVKIDGQEVKVTEIAKEAFKGNTDIKNVTIGANIKTIGDGAFKNAGNLTKVKFEGGNITKIGQEAFAGAKSLKSVDLSKQKNIESIGANAFKGCKNLTKFKINGNKLKKINKTAFKGCKNKKSVKVTIFAKNKKQYNKVAKLVKKAGLKKATFKYKKKK